MVSLSLCWCRAKLSSEKSNPQLNLVEFMRASPLFGLDELRFERTDSLAREIEL
jgi:hypothetical protein